MSLDRASSTSFGSFTPPPRLSQLQIGNMIGRGSYGVVYYGQLAELPVAVKVMEGAPGPDWDARRWAARVEAAIAMDLSHPNITKTLDWGHQEDPHSGKIWILQEMCDRGSLSEAVERGAFRQGQIPENPADMRSVLETALDVARGVQYLHSKNVLHADLSSNNVLLCTAPPDNYRGFTAKVTDFGLSRVAKNDQATKTFGTISHMAPELLMDGLMSQAADVYSFGTILWELWTGKRAWSSSSLAQIIFQLTVKRNGLKMPLDAPPEYCDLAMRCLSLEKSERPTFEEIIPKLEAMVAALDPIVSPS